MRRVCAACRKEEARFELNSPGGAQQAGARLRVWAEECAPASLARAASL